MTGHIIHAAALARYVPSAVPPYEIQPKARDARSGFWPLRLFQPRRPPRPATA